MGVEVVANELNFFGVRIIFVDQTLNFLSPIDAGAAVAARDTAPAFQRVEKHENRLHPPPFVVVVLTSRTTGSQRFGRPLIAQELLAGLVHADQRLFLAVLGSIEVEDVFHPGDESRLISLGYAPALLPPRLQRVFLSVLR